MDNLIQELRFALQITPASSPHFDRLLATADDAPGATDVVVSATRSERNDSAPTLM